MATATDSTAVGQGATANGANSTALGQGSTTASFTNATAIGSGAVATANNQFMMGTATNTYTAPGITSAASKAAQSGPLQLVTSDSGGNLATETPNSIVTGTPAFQNLQNQVQQNAGGVALAIALGGGPAILPDCKQLAVTASCGTFAGETAFGASGVWRVSDNVFLNGGVGAAVLQGTVGGRAGVTVAW
jgi:hypothetical protein